MQIFHGLQTSHSMQLLALSEVGTQEAPPTSQYILLDDVFDSWKTVCLLSLLISSSRVHAVMAKHKKC